MTDYDRSYKMWFKHPEIVQDLLQGFIHEDWVKKLDFTTLENVSGSYVADDIRDREDDVIWRLRYGHEWIYIYLLIEFQSSVDRWMALRVLTYVCLLYQDLVKTKKIPKNGKLPPVFPLVLYNGKKKWTAETKIENLIQTIEGDFAVYRPSFEYLLLDEKDYGNNDLAELKNLVAAIFNIESSKTAEDILAVVKYLKKWLNLSIHQQLRRDFIIIIKRVFAHARLNEDEKLPDITNFEEMEQMLTQQVKQWTYDWEQQGRQAGRNLFFKKVLKKRFGSLPDWVSKTIETATEKQIDGWLDNLFVVQSIEEIFTPNN